MTALLLSLSASRAARCGRSIVPALCACAANAWLAAPVSAQTMRRPGGTWGDDVFVDASTPFWGRGEVLASLLVVLALVLAYGLWQALRAAGLLRQLRASLRGGAVRPEPEDLEELRFELERWGRFVHPATLAAPLVLGLMTMVLGRRQAVFGVEIPLGGLALAAAGALALVAARVLLDAARTTLHRLVP